MCMEQQSAFTVGLPLFSLASTSLEFNNDHASDVLHVCQPFSSTAVAPRLQPFRVRAVLGLIAIEVVRLIIVLFPLKSLIV